MSSLKQDVASSPRGCVEVPSFGVTHAVCPGDGAFLTWDFGFEMKRWRQDEQVIQGASQYGLPPMVEWCITATIGTWPRNCTRSCRCLEF
jgi:hypothetical protein